MNPYWVKLTEPNGAPVYLEVSGAFRIRDTVAGEAASGAQTVIEFNNGQAQAVRESVASVYALVK